MPKGVFPRTEYRREINGRILYQHSNGSNFGIRKRRHSEETKRKISQTLKEKHIGFQKGYTPWNKGLTKETDFRVAESALKNKGKLKGEWVKCSNCGEPIYRNQSRLKIYKKHFCSRVCSIECSKTSLKVKCEICGKEVYRTLFKIKRAKHHLCSPECHAKWKKDKPLPHLKEVQFKKGFTPWNKGTKGVMPTPWNKDKPLSEEQRRKLSEIRLKNPNRYWLGKKRDEETNRKISKTKKKLYDEGKIVPFYKGKHLPEDFKKKLASAKVRNWKDPEYKKNQVKRIVRGLIKRPTSLEKEMIDIIKKYNLPYRYSGNGSFILGGKNPDFVNINGKRICIEVANTIHHPKSYPTERVNYFKKLGWDCIVFRVNNLNEKDVLAALKDFK